jgi:tetratricopeptide (TPR) repeat protein
MLPPDVLYDQEITYMDESIGDLFAAIPDEILKNTHVIAAADHGESFGQHGEETHGILTYDGALHVPLIIRPAEGSFPPGRVGTMVRLVDILPTVLSLTGQPVLESIAGRSLVPLLEGSAPEEVPPMYLECMGGHMIFGWGRITGLRTPTRKLIMAPVREVYDLEADPLEENNLYDEDSDLTLDLLDRYDALAEEVGADAEIVTEEGPALTAEERERLLALGYLGAGSDREDQPEKNPRDLIHVFYAIINLHMKMGDGKFDAVVEGCRELLRDDPDNPNVIELLTNALAEQGKGDEAAGILEEYLERHPGAVNLRRNLGAMYYRTGRNAEALAVWEGLEDSGDRDPRLFEGLAQLHLRDWPGHPPDAEASREYAARAIEDGSSRYDLLAEAYLALGQPEKGIEILDGRLDRCVDARAQCQLVLDQCRQAAAQGKERAAANPE